MATAGKPIDECSKCHEMQKSYLKTLDEKRTLLVRIQGEQEKSRKLRRDVEKLKGKMSGKRKATSVPQDLTETEFNDSTSKAAVNEEDREWRLDEAMHVNKAWKNEYERLMKSYRGEKSQLQREVDQGKCKLAEAQSQVLTLESEVIRLAESITEIHQNLETSTPRNSEHTDIIKRQLLAYKEDFTSERRDRERAQSEKESLQEQVQSAHEIIATLVQEVDMYKKEIKRNQEEKKLLLCRCHSEPLPRPVPEPQLEIVYPFVNYDRQQQLQWRQEQQRRQGIVTRGPMAVQPGAFYGADVEVDH